MGVGDVRPGRHPDLPSAAVRALAWRVLGDPALVEVGERHDRVGAAAGGDVGRVPERPLRLAIDVDRAELLGACGSGDREGEQTSNGQPDELAHGESSVRAPHGRLQVMDREEAVRPLGNQPVIWPVDPSAGRLRRRLPVRLVLFRTGTSRSAGTGGTRFRASPESSRGVPVRPRSRSSARRRSRVLGSYSYSGVAGRFQRSRKYLRMAPRLVAMLR